MSKFDKPSRSFSDKKKSFKPKDGTFKKDRTSSGTREKSDEEYASKKPFTKRDGSGKSSGYKGKSNYSSSDKEKDFKKKHPFTKSKEEGGYEKKPSRSFNKDKDSRSYERKPSRPYERKSDDKGEFKERRPFNRGGNDSSENKEEKNYKAKRSFTKNKEYRKESAFKKDAPHSFGKKREFGSKDQDRKKSFRKNDKYSDKAGSEKEEKFTRFSEKPERFSRGNDFKEKKSFGSGKPLRKKFDSEDRAIKRVKHDELEEGKSLGGYKKEFSKERSDKKTKTRSEPDGSTRLNKYLAHAGIASRREADTLIKSGVVKVNGVPVTEMGFKVKPGDTVTYGDSAVKSERKVYLLLNKPKDCITTVDDPQERNTVMHLVEDACKERIYPVGRLDRNTTGLLLLTNDGELTKKLTHPKHNIKKVYHVSLNKGLKPEDFKSITEGVELEDGLIAADDLAFIGEGKKEIGIEIHSGRNRVVRRLLEQLGYDVLKLDRVVFAGLTKKDLPRGKYRFLTEKEISFLQMIG